MKYLKNGLAIALCAAILTAGALLPKAVSLVSDNAKTNTSHKELEQISLNITPMTLLEKLGCFTDPTVIYVADYQAKTNVDDLFDVVAKEMLPYQNAGIVSTEIDFADRENWYMEYELAMCYNTYAPQKSNLFWMIEMSSDQYLQSHLELILDDDTGAIMHIHYETGEQFYSKNIPYSVMERMYMVFFDRLEVPLEQLNAIEIEPVSLSKTSTYVEFGWIDKTYGEMRIAFQVNEKAFFTYFPE